MPFYLKVQNNQVVSDKPFTLPQNYVDENGGVTVNVEKLSDLEKMTLGLFPVVDNKIAFNENYEFLVPAYTITASNVTIDYTIGLLPVTALHIQTRLETFAKQKDIDLFEICILLNSPNPVWQAEAQTLNVLYEATWAIYYTNLNSSWRDVELLLPELVW